VAKKGSKDHYLPAAMIGGFGERPANKPRRKAKVAAWVDTVGKVVITAAETAGWEYALYDVPGVAGSADMFEEVWQSYESDLPTAIEHLAEEIPSARDLDALVAHVAFAAARFAGFSESVVQWSQQQGGAITEAEARGERGAWLRAGHEVADWRWRAVHVPDKCVFVLPDTGYAVIKLEAEEAPFWVFLPLSPQIGVLVKRPGDGEPFGVDAMDYRQLTWTAGTVVNDASVRQQGRKALISHPSRAEELEEIATAARVPQTLRGGPYVGRNSDWW
jgi:hypothetical protein